MNLRPLLIASVVAVAVPAFTATAMDMQPGNRPPPMGMEDHPPMPPYLRGIKLTEEQRDKIFDLLHAQAPKMRT